MALLIKGAQQDGNGDITLQVHKDGSTSVPANVRSPDSTPAPPAAGGPSLIYISSGVSPSTGARATVPDNVNALFFLSNMPACTVKNFRLETSSHGDPIDIVVRNATTSETMTFQATNLGDLQGTAGLAFAEGDGMTVQGQNTAPGESGPWSLTGVFEVHPA